MFLGDDHDIIGQQQVQNNIRYVLEFVLLSLNNCLADLSICG
jgi:hypothetical protein